MELNFSLIKPKKTYKIIKTINYYTYLEVAFVSPEEVVKSGASKACSSVLGSVGSSEAGTSVTSVPPLLSVLLD